MAEIRLEDSKEFKRIRDIRGIVVNGIRGENISLAVYNSISIILNHLSQASAMPDQAPPPPSDKNDAGQSQQPSEIDSTRFFHDKRRDILQTIMRPEVIDNEVNAFKTRLQKSVYLIYAISNFAFAEPVFWMECESEDLKKYRATQLGEDPNITISKRLRRKAEDEYRGRMIDEAITDFIEADTKNPTDFTIQYQLGLIFFFEKADYTNAIYWFRKASKNSYNKSTQVFVHSMALMGLIMRLAARITRNNDLLSEAYQATAQAYNIDTGYFFSRYALAQCLSTLTAAEPFNQARVMLRDLVKKEKMFSFQIIHDVCFEPCLDQLGETLKTLTDETATHMTNVLEKIELTLGILNNSKAFVPSSHRIGAYENIHKKYLEQANSKNYFDMTELISRANQSLDELQAIITETEKNKKFCEIKEITEKLVAKYEDEYKKAAEPLIRTESKCGFLREELNKLNSTYPQTEHAHMKFVRRSDGTEELSAHSAVGHPGWKETGLFTIIKIISGSAVFAFNFIFILVFSFMMQETSFLFVALCGFINLILIPLYGKICGEVYYNVIEGRRKNMLKEYDMLRSELNVFKIKADESGAKLVEKYTRIMAETTQLSQFTCEKIFEFALEGNYEKIKSLI